MLHTVTYCTSVSLVSFSATFSETFQLLVADVRFFGVLQTKMQLHAPYYTPTLFPLLLHTTLPVCQCWTLVLLVMVRLTTSRPSRVHSMLQLLVE